MEMFISESHTLEDGFVYVAMLVSAAGALGKEHNGAARPAGFEVVPDVRSHMDRQACLNSAK
jgi:hypothetical protein